MKLKKLLSVILAAVMLLGCMSITAFAAESEGLAYSLNANEDGYIVDGIGTCTDTDIVIPAEHEGKPVTGISMRFSDPNITSVTIPYGVTSIEDGAFLHCDSLSNVTIPEGVTSLDGATFTDCPNLTSVSIPTSMTSIGLLVFFATPIADVTVGWTRDIPNVSSFGAFGGYSPSSQTLHVPAGTKEAYEAKGWSDNFNIVELPPEESDSDFLTTFPLSKDYTDTYTSEASTKVSEEIKFTIAPIGDAPEFDDDEVTMTVTSGVGSVDVTLPTDFEAAGDFWYTITESEGSIAGVTYNTTPCYLHLAVCYMGGEYKVVSAAIHTTENGEGDDDAKITTVSNSYGEGSLTVEQKTYVNGEENSDDTFVATVTFTAPEGTTITGEIKYGDLTIDPEVWENGSASVDIELKGGESVTFTGIPDGVTYTVEQTEGNENMGYQLDDVVFDVTDEEGDTVKDLVAYGTVSDPADTVTITNSKSVPIDVGVIIKNGAFVLIGVGALALGVYLVFAKRKEREYNEED